MNYTPEQLLAFKVDYASRRKRHMVITIAAIPCVIGFALLLSAGSRPWVPFALLAGALVYDYLWNWRCPACQNVLGGRLVNFCSACGVPLE